MSEAVPTVFVVDDDDRVRRAVQRLIQSVGLRVDAFASVQEFLDQYKPDRPGCLVLDVRMPGMSGLDLQQHLTQRHIDIPIVFVTGHGTIPMSVRAMKGGAVDFIEKPFDEQKLLDAIHVAIDRDKQSRRDREKHTDIQRRLSLLTPREREVMQLVVLGMMNKQIAAQFGTSEQTIKIHRGRVMEKMEADSLASLVVMAQMAGMRTAESE